jgi:chromosomal replication initiator protein
MEFEEDARFEVEPDASIHEPLSPEGMTAARAWPAVLRELQSDMPRATYERWVRDTVLLSARDGIFVVGAQSGYTRDWLESRLTSKIARLLAGICNTSMQIRFMELAAWGQ